MYVENNTDEIRMTAASWFLRKKKISTRIEIRELSCLIFLMEMIIPCALPQNKKKSFLKFQTGQLSRITLLKFSHIGNTHCLIRNLNFDWSVNFCILQKNFILIVSHKWSFQLINSVMNKNFLQPVNMKQVIFMWHFVSIIKRFFQLKKENSNFLKLPFSAS